ETETEENAGDAVAGASESLRELDLRNAYIAIFSGDHLLASNYPDDSPPGSISSRQFEPERSIGLSLGTDKQFGTAGARLCLVTGASGGCSILLAAPLAELQLELGSLRRVFYLGYPAALFIGGLGGMLLARQSLAPVVAMSDQAQRIGAGNLHR